MKKFLKIEYLLTILILLCSCNKTTYCSTYKSNYHNKAYNKPTTKCPTYGNDL